MDPRLAMSATGRERDSPRVKDISRRYSRELDLCLGRGTCRVASRQYTRGTKLDITRCSGPGPVDCASVPCSGRETLTATHICGSTSTEILFTRRGRMPR